MRVIAFGTFAAQLCFGGMKASLQIIAGILY